MPSILLLPSELKLHIAELSSPDSLAALARTHTTYQREAEKVLYHSLVIVTDTTYGDYFLESSIKCMETLATNLEKAALVRFLIIESYDAKKDRRVTTNLFKSLINMHSLSDFRVRWWHDEVWADDIKSLNNILCEGHFRLQILYCRGVLDVSQIIKSQTELQILGLCESRGPKYILTLKELHSAQIFLPIVLKLESKYLPYPNHISVFPVFYSVDRCATMHQVLAQSFCKDQGDYMRVEGKNINELSIYSSDMPSIYALAKGMALNFPQVHFLNLWFEHRCEIPPQTIKEEFSFFSKLRRVNTYVWPK